MSSATRVISLIGLCSLALSWPKEGPAQIVPPAPPSSVQSPPAAASAAAPAPVQTNPSPNEKPHELSGVTVKGEHDVLGDSDAKMKKLKDSLPTLDSDGLRKESLAQRVYDRTSAYLSSHKDINALPAASKTQVQHMQNELSVDRVHDGDKPPVPQPDVKDYVEPLCQTGSCPP